MTVATAPGQNVMSFELMRRVGVAAIFENNTLAVRPDLSDDRNLISHLTTVSNLRGLDNRKPLNAVGPGGGGGSSCTTVGATCNGLTVIGVVQANPAGGTSTYACSSSGGYSTGQSSINFPGNVLMGAQYTFAKFVSCLEKATFELATSMSAIAKDAILGGLSVYVTPAGNAALLGSARGLIAGSVSAAGFADVLAAVVSAPSLAVILTGVGGGISLDIMYETMKCEFSNFP